VSPTLSTPSTGCRTRCWPFGDSSTSGAYLQLIADLAVASPANGRRAQFRDRFPGNHASSIRAGMAMSKLFRPVLLIAVIVFALAGINAVSLIKKR